MINLINRPDLKPLFFQSYSEAEILANQELRRIDRLLVTPHHVWIVDFKSHTLIPKGWEDCPYKKQLEHYEELVRLVLARPVSRPESETLLDA